MESSTTITAAAPSTVLSSPTPSTRSTYATTPSIPSIPAASSTANPTTGPSRQCTTPSIRVKASRTEGHAHVTPRTSQPPPVSRPFESTPTSHEWLQFQYPKHPDYDVPSSPLIKPASESPVDRGGCPREPWHDERKSESSTGFQQPETEPQHASSWRGFAEWKT